MLEKKRTNKGKYVLFILFENFLKKKINEIKEW